MLKTGLYQSKSGARLTLRIVVHSSDSATASAEFFSDGNKPSSWMKTKLIKVPSGWTGTISVFSGATFTLGEKVDVVENANGDVDFKTNNVATKLKWISRYLRSLSVFVDQVSNFLVQQSLPVATDLVNQQTHSIVSIFDSALVEVSVSEPNFVPASLSSSGYWSDGEIYSAFLKRQTQLQKPWTVWLFLTGKYADRSVEGTILRGLTNKLETRLGCAVFYDNITRKGGSPEYLDRWKTWTVIHELGHCLNLVHIDSEPCFMTTRSSLKPSFFSSFNFQFGETALSHLHHEREDIVRPGASSFRGDSGYSKEVEYSSPSLSLAIDSEKFITAGEPVLLKLTLKNIHDVAVEIDNILNPKWGFIDITVQHRDKTVDFTPLMQAFGKPKRKRLERGEALSEYVWLHSMDGSAIFDRLGRYKITARIPGLMSNRHMIDVISRTGNGTRRPQLQQLSDPELTALFQISGLHSNALTNMRNLVEEMATDYGDTKFGIKCAILLARESRYSKQMQDNDPAFSVAHANAKVRGRNFLDKVLVDYLNEIVNQDS